MLNQIKTQQVTMRIIIVKHHTKISNLQNELENDVTIETTTSIISTGTIIRKGTESYTAVVKGDLTGDGMINSTDLLAMQHLLYNTSLY